MQIEDLLKNTAAEGASDLFVSAGKVPYCRKCGKVIPMGKKIITQEDIDSFRQKILLPEAEESYRANGSFDAGITGEDKIRFRINFLQQQGLPGLVARPVPLGDDLDFKELNLPNAVKELAKSSRGLILLSGTAGSGKSTTLATILNYINTNSQRHIVTIEDPIEFVHHDKKSLITQREVGADTAGFSEALRNVVRESPDVIIVGEMRDLNTMQTAITAALTGHLVLSTVHTADTVQAIERIVNHFPEHLRAQAADDLSLALCGVIGQRLVPKADGSGMIPAVEILKATPHMRNLIATRDFKSMEDAIRRGFEEGMITFNRALSELCRHNLVSIPDGADASTNRDEFLLLVQGMESGIDTFRDWFRNHASLDDEVDMKRLLYAAVASGSSDLILSVGVSPCVRHNGVIAQLDVPALTPSDTQRLLFSILTSRQRAEFEEKREIDFALTTELEDSQGQKHQYRFRVNGFYQRGNIGTAIRVIPSLIPSLESLGIPQSIINLTDKHHGLILVTGPTGHGKSTSLAAMIDRINSSRGCHIITVEDPIEYVHENKMAVVEQREVHADTLSFGNALKYVLRQDPDVILIGEMRDMETIAAALTAAETGHLVLATLHTNSAPLSVDRIIDSFPGHQQNQIKMQLSGCLLGIISQRLIPQKDADGRVAAFEVLIGTPAVLSLIRDGRTAHIQSVMETSFKDGMITMDKALETLYNQNRISREALQGMSRITSHSQAY